MSAHLKNTNSGAAGASENAVVIILADENCGAASAGGTDMNRSKHGPTTVGPTVRCGISDLDETVAQLRGCHHTVVIYGRGHLGLAALRGAARCGADIDAVVLQDIVLSRARPAPALFSGLAALSSLGWALAGTAVGAAPKAPAVGFDPTAVRQPVMIIDSGAPCAQRRNGLAFLQSRLGGLVETVTGAGQPEDGFDDRIAAFASGVARRAARLRQRRPQRQPQPQSQSQDGSRRGLASTASAVTASAA